MRICIPKEAIPQASFFSRHLPLPFINYKRIGSNPIAAFRLFYNTAKGSEGLSSRNDFTKSTEFSQCFSASCLSQAFLTLVSFLYLYRGNANKPRGIPRFDYSCTVISPVNMRKLCGEESFSM
ncbi:MAG: hypothetical protein J5849_07120, partial [Clostridia bacterium]|nr:hypothetical protein [Clostridia bacterium]